MPRRHRFADGGFVYHVLNRAAGRSTIFATDGDYNAFLRTLDDASREVPTRLLAYCVMPNHFHLILWPRSDGELSRYMHWMTTTHTQRWHAAHGTSGTGPLYQGRFKAFPVQEDDHFYTVCRYVERNPLRANLASRAELWKWSSLWQTVNGVAPVTLSQWPLTRPAQWVAHVNEPQSEAEVAALRHCVQRGRPYGADDWTVRTAQSLGLTSSLRPTGRTPSRF
jgi:putative transposase